jgi:hypothetical protein
MHPVRTALACSLTLSALLALGLVARAQTPSPVPATDPSPATSGAADCSTRSAPLGGIGRASVVAFTGRIFGDHVCATVANLTIDGYRAALAQTAQPGALVSATVMPGSGGTLSIAPDGTALVTAGTASGPGAVGPLLIAPGGTLAVQGGDTTALPRVVLAYGGQRLLVIGTTPVTLVDLARILRDQPDLFGAETVERAVVLASGPAAAVSLQTDAGPISSGTPAGAEILSLTKRT